MCIYVPRDFMFPVTSDCSQTDELCGNKAGLLPVALNEEADDLSWFYGMLQFLITVANEMQLWRWNKYNEGRRKYTGIK